MLRVVNRVADGVWLNVPQPNEWRHIGDQIDTAMIPARAHFVSVLSPSHRAGHRLVRLTIVVIHYSDTSVFVPVTFFTEAR